MSPDVLLECPRTSFRDVLRVNVTERVWIFPLIVLMIKTRNTNFLKESGRINLSISWRRKRTSPVPRTVLEEELEKIGALCIFTLKFHPELNPVESRYRLA